MLRTVTVTRYVTPLREGGSLPAIVEGNDDGLYVLKFRGAGQGVKALIAELIAGELGRALGLPVPEIREGRQSISIIRHGGSDRKFDNKRRESTEPRRSGSGRRRSARARARLRHVLLF